MSQHSVKFDETKRHAVYLRDGYKCGYTGQIDKTYTGVGLSLDHIKARANGGAPQNTKLSPGTNLITSSQSANYAKQDKTPKQWEAYCKANTPPDGGVKVDFKDVRKQAGGKLDLKRGEELAKNAKEARAARGPNGEETEKSRAIAAKSAKIVEAYHAEKKAAADKKAGGGKKDGGADKPAGPGIQHDDKGRFTGPGGHIMPTRPARARFCADVPRVALAMDPGGSGLIALVLRGQQPQPKAFGFFDVPRPVAFDPETVEDGVGILALTGPLEHHESGIWQSYETLTREADCMLGASDVRAGIVKIDSPGGVAAGMGECHKALRRMQAKYGKPLYAYADQMACSAAYNVASACVEVWTSEEGVLGSVGVILCTVDETAALKKAGVAIRYVVTGARKADLHPGQPITDDVLDVAQAKVDYLGGLFFAAVGKARGVSAAHVQGLQAGVFHGPDAVKVRLADGVAGWPKFLRTVKESVGSGSRNAAGARVTVGGVRRIVAQVSATVGLGGGSQYDTPPKQKGVTAGDVRRMVAKVRAA